MPTDVSEPIASGPKPTWDLPDILDIQIRRIPYEPPKLRNFRSVLAEYSEAVEFIVRTSAPVPVRAMGPALFIGDTMVIESQEIEKNVYRFLAFNVDNLVIGSSISFGWIGDPAEDRKATNFTYREG